MSEKLSGYIVELGDTLSLRIDAYTLTGSRTMPTDISYILYKNGSSIDSGAGTVVGDIGFINVDIKDTYSTGDYILELSIDIDGEIFIKRYYLHIIDSRAI